MGYDLEGWLWEWEYFCEDECGTVGREFVMGWEREHVSIPMQVLTTENHFKAAGKGSLYGPDAVVFVDIKGLKAVWSWQQYRVSVFYYVFGRPFVKRFAISYRTIVRLPILYVGDVGGKWLRWSVYHLVRWLASAQATLCQMGTLLPHGKGHSSPPPTFWPTAHAWSPSQQLLSFCCILSNICLVCDVTC